MFRTFLLFRIEACGSLGFTGAEVWGAPLKEEYPVLFFLDRQWENFKLFGLIFWVYPEKFQLFWAWLLKKGVCLSNGDPGTSCC